jgi:Leucine-rich repeat (LRR) protein
LKELQLLDLKSNELAELPAEIGMLKLCTKIDISHNMLTVPPPQVILNSLELLRNNCSHKYSSFSFSVSFLSLFSFFSVTFHFSLLLFIFTFLFSLFSSFVTNENVQELPWEMGNLTVLNILDVGHNPLIIPPRPVINKGTTEVLLWLKKNEKEGRKTKVTGLSQKKEGK